MKNSTVVTPSILFVDDLLDEVDRGRLLVPAFQRAYVWKKKNIIELFDSIYRGFPIGSVLFWETDCNLKTHDNFELGISDNHDGRKYILDGQQRITTLYHCLKSNPTQDSLWDVFFNLETEKFVYSADATQSDVLFPLSRIIRTMDFIKQSTITLSETGDESLVLKAEVLANRIRKYKLAIVDLKGGEIDEAVDIFTRLNKTGMPIIPVDVISALNFNNEDVSYFDELRESILTISQQFSFIKSQKDDVGSVDGDIVVRLIRISLGLEIYAKNDTESVASRVRQKSFMDKSKLISDAYRDTIRYFVEELNFRDLSELPYSNLLYMVFAYFYYDGKNYAGLRRVVYLGSMTGFFNESPSGVQKIIEYFSSDFDSGLLTAKLEKNLSSVVVESKLEEILSNDFNAKSAAGKLVFNILINCCMGSKEYFRYPPKLIYPDAELKARLGNKLFFEQSDDEIKSNLFSGITDDEISRNDYLKSREDKIVELVESFFREII